MSDEMDLYLIQSPDVLLDDDNLRGYNKDLLRAYKNSIPVTDMWDFIGRLTIEVTTHHRLIKKLVIGSHGAGIVEGTGHFFLGGTMLNARSINEINNLRVIAPFFAKNADVYILACKTGYAGELLRKVSKALGGVRVHGYTDYITTSNWGLWVTVDDGTDDEGKEIVCWPGECRDFSYTNPRTGNHPLWPSN
jgi:hypothetical protein